MRQFLMAVILCAVVCGVTLVSTGGENQPGVPKDMTQYFVGVLYRGEKWSPQVTEEVTELQKAHLANIGRLADERKLVMAGPFGDGGDMRGLFFFDVKTMEEAQKLVDTDPAVKAGRLRVELHPWWGPTSLRRVLDDMVNKTDDAKPKTEAKVDSP
ncbi:MAG: hypothetical protein DHS20C16_08960 [Phycisphaerae bacterium]|nr:MAG: hypothetical protein DHS20C16_08960 [Phycisphaerae bacterium]